jgi:hypothetical protein
VILETIDSQIFINQITAILVEQLYRSIVIFALTEIYSATLILITIRGRTFFIHSAVPHCNPTAIDALVFLTKKLEK